MTNFYDSTRPELIPAGTDACLYADGLYAASPEQAKRFANVRWITVEGGAPAAAYAGCIDFELHNPAYSPQALRDWAEARLKNEKRARVYCNRNDFPWASSIVSGLENVVWWIATLDGNKLSPTWTRNMWGVQYLGGISAAYDTSVLYGVW